MLQELISNLRPTGHVGEGKGKLIPGRGHSICKHLKVRMHTACSCNGLSIPRDEKSEGDGKSNEQGSER